MIKEFWDKYNGQDIYSYTISDKISVKVCNLGATILSILVPSSNGGAVDVALGMTNASDVVEKGGYMGSVVGRCGNRIANGKFALNGKGYTLACNNGNAHLHGGNVGFNRKVWDVTNVSDNSITMQVVSPDGDEGYPNELTLAVTYTVKETALIIDYCATSNGYTICNPTNHTYFNLNGQSDGSILDNVVTLYSDSFLAVNKDLIPVATESVIGTPFDFRTAKPIGKDIDCVNEQLIIAGGYDHNYCLNGNHVATVYSVKTGIQMDAYTDMPGVQFYSGNFLVGNVGKSVYNKRSGFCLETQRYPDSINHPDYPSVVIAPNESMTSQTKYSFSVRKN